MDAEGWDCGRTVIKNAFKIVICYLYYFAQSLLTGRCYSLFNWRFVSRKKLVVVLLSSLCVESLF